MNKHLIQWILWIIFILSFSSTKAQYPDWENYTSNFVNAIAFEGDYVWTGGDGLCRLNSKTGEKVFYNHANSGLPSNEIRTIVIDNNGIKWIGTIGGLVKFDGTNWTTYNTTNSGLPDNVVLTIAIDSSDNKWIGTWSRGLAKFDGITWTVYNTSNSGLPDNQIRAISIDQKGNKWIGTLSGGLSKFDGTNWTNYNQFNSGLPRDGVDCIAIDSNGNKWIGISGIDLTKFDGTNWTNYNQFNSGLPDYIVRCITIDAEGNIWIGTYGGGIAKFDGSNWTTYNSSNSSLQDNFIYCITIDAKGNKWIGTGGGGLSKFDGSNWTTYNSSNSGLPENSICCISFDAQGNKWIGTGGGGLSKFDKTNWTTYNSTNSGLPDNSIYCISFDAQENKWIGTYDGLTNFKGVNWKTYNSTNSELPYNYIRSIAIDIQGNKWIGTYGGGIAKFDGNNWTIYNTSNSGLLVNYIRSITIDTQGNKWIGSYGGGLVKFDGSNWTTYNSSNSGLPDNYVYCITIDAQGNKWIGTRQVGLVKFDGMNWTVYNPSNSGLPYNVAYCITIDAQGNKWIGTYGGGIAKFDGNNWTIYNTSNSGLPNNEVSCITIDAQGNKWIGTYGGLAFFKGGNSIQETPNFSDVNFGRKRIFSPVYNPTEYKENCTITYTGTSKVKIIDISIEKQSFNVFRVDVLSQPLEFSKDTTLSIPVYFKPDQEYKFSEKLKISYSINDTLKEALVNLSGTGCSPHIKITGYDFPDTEYGSTSKGKIIIENENISPDFAWDLKLLDINIRWEFDGFSVDTSFIHKNPIVKYGIPLEVPAYFKSVKSTPVEAIATPIHDAPEIVSAKLTGHSYVRSVQAYDSSIICSIGNQAKVSVKIKNVGSKEVKVTNIKLNPLISSLRIENPLDFKGFLLAERETREIGFIYNPTFVEEGIMEVVYSIDISGDSIGISHIKYKSIEPCEITAGIESMDVSPSSLKDKYTDIKVNLLNYQNTANWCTLDSLEASIKIYKNLFLPKDDKYTDDSLWRTIKVKRKTSAQKVGDLLFSIPGTVLLGDSVSSPIIIDDIYFKGIYAPVLYENGILKLKDLKYYQGKPILLSFGNPITIQIAPNPANETINIDIGNLKHTDCKVELYNQLGILMFEDFIQSENKNESKNFNILGYPPGLYTVRISSGSEKCSGQFIITN